MDQNKIISEIVDLLEIKKKKKITAKYKFKDLDSLNKLKLMGYLSENYNISLSLDKLEKIFSIEDILRIIKKNS